MNSQKTLSFKFINKNMSSENKLAILNVKNAQEALLYIHNQPTIHKNLLPSQVGKNESEVSASKLGILNFKVTPEGSVTIIYSIKQILDDVGKIIVKVTVVDKIKSLTKDITVYDFKKSIQVIIEQCKEVATLIINQKTNKSLFLPEQIGLVGKVVTATQCGIRTLTSQELRATKITYEIASINNELGTMGLNVLIAIGADLKIRKFITIINFATYMSYLQNVGNFLQKFDKNNPFDVKGLATTEQTWYDLIAIVIKTLENNFNKEFILETKWLKTLGGSSLATRLIDDNVDQKNVNKSFQLKFNFHKTPPFTIYFTNIKSSVQFLLDEVIKKIDESQKTKHSELLPKWSRLKNVTAQELGINEPPNLLGLSINYQVLINDQTNGVVIVEANLSKDKKVVKKTIIVSGYKSSLREEQEEFMKIVAKLNSFTSNNPFNLKNNINLRDTWHDMWLLIFQFLKTQFSKTLVEKINWSFTDKQEPIPISFKKNLQDSGVKGEKTTKIFYIWIPISLSCQKVVINFDNIQTNKKIIESFGNELNKKFASKDEDGELVSAFTIPQTSKYSKYSVKKFMEEEVDDEGNLITLERFEELWGQKIILPKGVGIIIVVIDDNNNNIILVIKLYLDYEMKNLDEIEVKGFKKP